MAETKYEDTMIAETIAPFAMILATFAWFYIIPLLLPHSEVPFEGRLWAFRDDMNGDGRVTIRDVWAMPGWLFLYPGDLVIHYMYHYEPRIAQDLQRFAEFFEVRPIWYGGLFSVLVSIVAWPLLCLSIILSYWVFLLPGRIYWDSRRRMKDMSKWSVMIMLLGLPLVICFMLYGWSQYAEYQDWSKTNLIELDKVMVENTQLELAPIYDVHQGTYLSGIVTNFSYFDLIEITAEIDVYEGTLTTVSETIPLDVPAGQSARFYQKVNSTFLELSARDDEPSPIGLRVVATKAKNGPH